MANTYTRIYLHIVIRIKRGHPIIKADFEEKLYAYIGGIIKNQGHLPVRINGYRDHVHILFAQRPTSTLSDLMREVKSDSSRMVNEEGWTRRKFRWQTGFGAFSCDHHNLERIIQYIKRQKEHHTRHSYIDEYRKILRDYEVEYVEKYLEDQG